MSVSEDKKTAADVLAIADAGRNDQSKHSRRKVFYLVDSLNIGGTETQAVELALRIPGPDTMQPWAVSGLGVHCWNDCREAMLWCESFILKAGWIAQRGFISCCG